MNKVAYKYRRYNNGRYIYRIDLESSALAFYWWTWKEWCKLQEWPDNDAPNIEVSRLEVLVMCGPEAIYEDI